MGEYDTDFLKQLFGQDKKEEAETHLKNRFEIGLVPYGVCVNKTYTLNQLGPLALRDLIAHLIFVSDLQLKDIEEDVKVLRGKSES